MSSSDSSNVPVTKIRLRIPSGMKVSDVISRLEVTFEEIEPTGAEIRPNLDCCVDATVISPVSTVNAR
ncbi:hypothetical protein [Blastococcus montanus]|uniref:hypothetical protein n=1 Tax=Blastococcus montanus TaxID=3144973 RepID=UPI003207A189